MDSADSCDVLQKVQTEPNEQRAPKEKTDVIADKKKRKHILARFEVRQVI
jgi:hypothetical protein